jgi:hypothetical protein
VNDYLTWWVIVSVAVGTLAVVAVLLALVERRRDRNAPGDPEFEAWLTQLGEALPTSDYATRKVDFIPAEVLQYREYVAALCVEAVRLQRVYDRYLADYTTESSPYRHTLLGKIIGIRVALCVLHGWDVEDDSAREGRADRFIEDWHDAHPDVDRYELEERD